MWSLWLACQEPAPHAERGPEACDLDAAIVSTRTFYGEPSSPELDGVVHASMGPAGGIFVYPTLGLSCVQEQAALVSLSLWLGEEMLLPESTELQATDATDGYALVEGRLGTTGVFPQCAWHDAFVLLEGLVEEYRLIDETSGEPTGRTASIWLESRLQLDDILLEICAE